MARARAIWKGQLVLGKGKVPVGMYSAIQDRKVHFHLLHAKDLAPVHQRIVRKRDGKEVPKNEQLKAFPLSKDKGVIIRAEELEKIQPQESHDIHLCRFVSRSMLSEQWYDRPYYLGPEKDAKSYFAIAEALEREDVVGVARWVMRKQPYLGALTAVGGYLMMITLRRAEQILSVSKLDILDARKPDEKELKLATQLVTSIEGDFEPSLWKDEYHDRLCDLIEAKARGKTIQLAAPKPKRATGDLAETLRRSLTDSKERKVA